MRIYTDPNRLRATDPGKVENNPLWIFHDTFNSDAAWIETAKERYRAGTIGDVDCKKKLVEVILSLLEPMQKRRAEFSGNEDYILSVIRSGAEKANQLADKTLKETKAFMKQVF